MERYGPVVCRGRGLSFVTFIIVVDEKILWLWTQELVQASVTPAAMISGSWSLQGSEMGQGLGCPYHPESSRTLIPAFAKGGTEGECSVGGGSMQFCSVIKAGLPGSLAPAGSTPNLLKEVTEATASPVESWG